MIRWDNIGIWDFCFSPKVSWPLVQDYQSLAMQIISKSSGKIVDMGEEWIAIDLCQHCDAIKDSWVKDELYLDRWWGGQHHSDHLIESR